MCAAGILGAALEAGLHPQPLQCLVVVALAVGASSKARSLVVQANCLSQGFCPCPLHTPRPSHSCHRII